jgi:hypothetical protein
MSESPRGRLLIRMRDGYTHALDNVLESEAQALSRILDGAASWMFVQTEGKIFLQLRCAEVLSLVWESAASLAERTPPEPSAPTQGRRLEMH